MPDIAMCQNNDCPLREGCYRFTAKPAKWQWYNDFKPKNDKCDHFIDNKTYKTKYSR